MRTRATGQLLGPSLVGKYPVWLPVPQSVGVPDRELSYICDPGIGASPAAQRVVMEILGHSQISMTSRYAHVLPQVMTDAAERIGRVLWGET